MRAGRRRRWQDLSLQVAPGEVVGIVGESGSGKSTLLRAIAGLLVPDSGSITFGGEQLPWRCDRRSQEARREIQIVFQNPDASLNPRQTVSALIDHPLHRFLPGLSAAQRRAADPRCARPAAALARPAGPLPGGAERRPAAASRPWPRACRRSCGRAMRRDHLGTRRVRAGIDPGVARRAAEGAGARHGLRHP